MVMLAHVATVWSTKDAGCTANISILLQAGAPEQIRPGRAAVNGCIQSFILALGRFQ